MQKFILVLSLLLISACGRPEHRVIINGADPSPERRFKEDATLSFETASVIFNRHSCMGCHTEATGNKGGINLETYDNTVKWAQEIKSTVTLGFMPLRGPRINGQDLSVLTAWIDAGAPEFSDLPLELSFATVRAQIFTPHCVRCHSGFSEYAKVKPRIADIQLAVESNRMPKDRAPLSLELKELLRRWIDAGLPEGEL